MRQVVRQSLLTLQLKRQGAAGKFLPDPARSEIILEEPAQPKFLPPRNKQFLHPQTAMGYPLYLATRFWNPLFPRSDIDACYRRFVDRNMKRLFQEQRLPFPTVSLAEMHAWMAPTKWPPKSHITYYNFPCDTPKYFSVRQSQDYGQVAIIQYLPYLRHENRFTETELRTLIKQLAPQFPKVTKFTVTFYQGSSYHDNMELIIVDGEVYVTKINNSGSEWQAK